MVLYWKALSSQCSNALVPILAGFTANLRFSQIIVATKFPLLFFNFHFLNFSYNEPVRRQPLLDNDRGRPQKLI